jgi:8-oxo-dGTP pyrophosphatase MutT (NUDIX family)
VLWGEPRTCEPWFLASIVLPNKKRVDAAVRELIEETGFILTVDNLTLLSGKLVRMPLPAREYHPVYVFSLSVHVPYVNANMRTPAKVKQAVTA